MSTIKLVVREYLTTSVLGYLSLIHMPVVCGTFQKQTIVTTALQLCAQSFQRLSGGHNE